MQLYEFKETQERVILIGVQTGVGDDVEASLDELDELAQTAGAETAAKVIQNREAVHPGTYIGKGKIEEVASLLRALDANGVICDDELSPAQLNNLERELDCKVMDRTLLILDIFAGRAVSSEGKIQVELAQLRYRAARLVGLRESLSRLGGGIGTRGPGEKKLEMDRRLIHERIGQLKSELEDVKRHREVTRKQRDRKYTLSAAIVGYTNAGKSTLLNTLTGAGILAQDKLFATLDPTTRGLKLASGQEILLTDTVGFIRKLPHHLVHAFRSTLEEAVSADVLAVVVDASDPEYRAQLETTDALLEELGASGKPTLYVFNKCDKGAAESFRAIGTYAENRRTVCISAATGQGIDLMLGELQDLIHEGKKRVVFVIPNAEAGVLSRLYAQAVVENVDYGDEAMTVTAVVDAKTRGMYRKYDPSWVEADE